MIGMTNLTHDIFYHCDDRHCISNDLVCNGIQDCPNAQDETVLQCGKTINLHCLIIIILYNFIIISE